MSFNIKLPLYQNNTAQYGNEVASYAVKITFANDTNTSINIDDVGSGIAYPEKLEFAVRDYDNQIMNLNNQDQIIMSSVNSSTTQVKGFNAAILKKGVTSFNNLIVIAEPGSPKIKVAASSKAIDQRKITKIFGSPISSNILNMNLRECIPGEELEGKACRECSAGTYSLQWNSPSCLQCIEGAVCEGGIKINVNSGYWRQTLNSTSIIECENKDACKGGFFNSYNQPTKCATGYKGNLCMKCDIVGSTKYQEVGDFKCQKCPNPIMNGLRVFGVVTIVFIYFMLIITVNIKKTTENSMSVLLRIFTNYVQILTSALSFSSSQPDLITDIFIPVKNIGDSSTAFMSFDCFIGFSC